MRTFTELRKKNPGTAERIAYVDFKLRFTGLVKRAEIGEMFAVGDAAASKILSAYSKERPENMEHNRALKANAILRESYKPLLNMDAETALGMLANGFNRNKLTNPPTSLISYEKIDKIPNQLDIETVAKITRAIAGRHSVTCHYLSENSDNHDSRTLLPLSIMHDGVNWMFRAYHREDNGEGAFKTFHFARIDRTEEVAENFSVASQKRQSHEDVGADKAWNLKIPLQLKLHDYLKDNEKLKSRIRTDYGMPQGAEEIMIPTRSAYLWILQRKWFIDCRDPLKRAQDEESGIRPFYKFELVNREMVEMLRQQNI